MRLLVVNLYFKIEFFFFLLLLEGKLINEYAEVIGV